MQIYLTKNTVNDKMYIGKDSKSDPKYLGSGLVFKKAILKYGKNNFSKIILEDNIKTLEELNEKERFYIKEYNAVESNLFYNIMDGGSGGDFYSNHPEKEKLREKFIANLKKIDLSFMRTEEYKKMLSERFSRSICQFTKSGEFIKKFDSLELVCKEYKGSKGNLCSAASGKRNYWKGYRWSYTDKPNCILNSKTGRKKGTKNSYKIERNHLNIMTVKVICYEDGIFFKIFESREKAAEYFGTSKETINQYIVHKRQYRKKFTFEKGEAVKKTIYK